jgi:hypothetical protein
MARDILVARREKTEENTVREAVAREKEGEGEGRNQRCSKAITATALCSPLGRAPRKVPMAAVRS